MLEIINLHASIEDKPILRGMNLTIRPGEIHVVMGPNGAGKSTLANVLAGHPSYEVTEGEILFQGKNLVELEPEERAHLGVFLSFQYPIEITGISNFQFLYSSTCAMNKARGLAIPTEEEFSKKLDEAMALMDMKSEFKYRNLNEGFSGGEKKRNEILQMLLLEPRFAILDETDSGLDIDAMRIVAKGINSIASPERSLLLITHYQRLLDYIRPDFVHVAIDGKIVATGGPELALRLEKEGYDFLSQGQVYEDSLV
ncbi:MAG: Fe-S cluster assembly ATPase SufC [Chlamydiae bacterium]|nr:Fe-S cluster assembly ATPase SufC [Chlamydiota bacterium]